MKTKAELNQRLLDTLDRWERAYTGYALMAVTPQKRRETLATGTPSEENIGNLIGETRKLLSSNAKDQTSPE